MHLKIRSEPPQEAFQIYDFQRFLAKFRKQVRSHDESRCISVSQCNECPADGYFGGKDGATVRINRDLGRCEVDS